MAPDKFIKKTGRLWRWLVPAALAVAALLLVTVLCLQKCSGPGSPGSCGFPDTGQATPDQPGLTEPTELPEVPDAPDTQDTAEPAGSEAQDPTGEPQKDPEKPDQDHEKDPEKEPDTKPGPVQQPLLPVQEEPKCSQFAVFSGSFVEDGSDEPVQNVAAILVTNDAEQYLDLAELTYLLDGEEASFRVTGLPPGTSAWVMESSRRTAKGDSVFTQQDCTASYRAEAVDTLEGLSVQTDGTMLKVTNNRSKTLKNLTLYYKVVHNDGNYFGGITYMVTFGDLEPEQSAEKLAGHFNEGWTDIVRIGYQEEP